MQRRDFLAGGAIAAATALLSPAAEAAKAKTPAEPVPCAPPPPPPLPERPAAPTGPFTLPPLPYSEEALAPVISRDTMFNHYWKHHRNYVVWLNDAVAQAENADFAKMSLDQVIKESKGSGKASVFNNAAQVSHHTFYWESMKAGGGGAPTDSALLALFDKHFGGFEAFKTKWIDDASKLFGAGWCWLVWDDSTLKIDRTSNAELPVGKPLMVIDVWEHAYYLDYQSRRRDYVTGWTEKLIDWDRVVARLNAK